MGIVKSSLNCGILTLIAAVSYCLGNFGISIPSLHNRSPIPPYVPMWF